MNKDEFHAQITQAIMKGLRSPQLTIQEMFDALSEETETLRGQMHVRNTKSETTWNPNVDRAPGQLDTGWSNSPSSSTWK